MIALYENYMKFMLLLIENFPLHHIFKTWHYKMCCFRFDVKDVWSWEIWEKMASLVSDQSLFIGGQDILQDDPLCSMKEMTTKSFHFIWIFIFTILENSKILKGFLLKCLTLSPYESSFFLSLNVLLRNPSDLIDFCTNLILSCIL